VVVVDRQWPVRRALVAHGAPQIYSPTIPLTWITLPQRG